MRLEGYKAGKFVRNENYKTFILSKINYDWTWEDGELNRLIAEASREIGELNIYSKLLPNVDIYQKMLSNLEIQKSSEIEGSKTTLEENLLNIENVSLEKREDWERANKCIKAFNYGEQRIRNGESLSKNFLKELHKKLLKGEEEECLGIFRTSQNWVGDEEIRKSYLRSTSI